MPLMTRALSPFLRTFIADSFCCSTGFSPVRHGRGARATKLRLFIRRHFVLMFGGGISSASYFFDVTGKSMFQRLRYIGKQRGKPRTTLAQANRIGRHHHAAVAGWPRAATDNG